MPFYEVTYETGRVSVAFYDDDEQALAAVGEQHRRATAGEVNGPQGSTSERIKAVRVYAKHPNEWNPDQTMSAEVLNKEVTEKIKALSDDNGIVDLQKLSMAVAGLSHPMVESRKDAFESIFKMKEDKNLKLPFVTAEGGN